MEQLKIDRDYSLKYIDENKIEIDQTLIINLDLTNFIQYVKSILYNSKQKRSN